MRCRMVCFEFYLFCVMLDIIAGHSLLYGYLCRERNHELCFISRSQISHCPVYSFCTLFIPISTILLLHLDHGLYIPFRRSEKPLSLFHDTHFPFIRVSSLT